MTSMRRPLLVLGLIATIGFGCSALLAPVAAASKNCPQGCPATKKIHGFVCVFNGCDAVTNQCTYICRG